jgi:hypothetical protein
MSQTLKTAIAVIGVDIGKNSFHVVGHDKHGAIVLRQKWSRGQVEARFANAAPAARGTFKSAQSQPINHSQHSWRLPLTTAGCCNSTKGQFSRNLA